MFTELVPSWSLSLRSARKAKGTVEAYQQGVRQFAAWCIVNDHIPALTRNLVQQWVADMLDRGLEPNTVRIRQYAVIAFSRWLYNEREIEKDELENMPLVKPDKKVVVPLTDEELTALLAACRGNTLLDRRDEALIRLMAETGARAREVTGMTIKDLNLSAMTAVIYRGKGGKGRMVGFSPECAGALDRYLRMRRREGDTCPFLWINQKGRQMGYNTLNQALQLRADKIGLKVHPHLFRHTAAARWLRAGGSEQGLMAIAGWSTRTMMDRYTSANATERALDEAKRLNLGDI